LKTDDLIAMLSNRVHAIDPSIAARRYLIAIAVGGIAAIAILVTALGINPGLAHETLVPMFWVREAFCLGLGTLAITAVARLGRPGVPLGRLGMAVPVPLIVMWLLAAIALFNAPAGGRVPLLLGGSAAACPFRIAVISSPLFLAFIWALRGFAPTRLRCTGAVAGFAAGALGALVYTLHCPELAAPFLGVWYLLGMLIPTSIGAFLGPRLLRW